MRLVPRWIFAFASLVLVVGCEDVFDAGVPLELRIDSQSGPLEGVRVCEGDTNCDVSDADGEVTLGVPFGREIFYTLEKEGHDSLLFAQIIPEDGFSAVWYLQTDGEIAPFYDEMMSPYPRRGTGQIQIFLDPAIAGVTVDLLGATGEGYYEVYPWDPPPHVDPELEATTSSGSAGFVEVTPGDFQVQLGGTAQRCAPFTAWPDEVENRVRVRVREGHNSIVIIRCPPVL